MLSCLLANTLLAAGAALLVCAIARWGRPAPAALHALWVVVLLKLLSPFGLVYPLALGFEAPTEAPIQARASEPARLAAVDLEVAEETFFFAAVPEDVATDALPPSQGEVTLPPSAASPAAAPPRRPGPSVFGLLMLVWVGGAGCVAGRQLWQTGRFARRARRARPAPEAIVRHVARLAQRLGVRAPAVRVLPGLASPVVWALGRPVLLWPAGLEDRLAESGRDAVLLHELAHLRRGDHWTRWLELATAVVHWWNPLFWLARRQVRFQAELACDAWVTGTLPGGRRAYAEALLEVCSTVARAAAPSPAVGVGGDGRRDFQRRLTMIMREQVPCRLSGRGKLAVALMAAALLPGWVFAQEEKPPAVEEVVEEIILVDAGDKPGPADAEREKKLKALEAKIAELTKELKALRAGKPAPAADGRTLRVEEAKPKTIVAETVVKTPRGQGQTVIIRVVDENGKLIKEYREGSEPAADTLKKWADLQKHALKMAEAAQADAAKATRQIEIDAKQKAEAARADAMKKAVEARAKAQGAAADIVKRANITITSGGASNVVMLSRATYKLPRDKAEALAKFIESYVQAKVLEVKVDGDGLTVTTTPELQQAIGTLVNLMAGKATSAAPAQGPNTPARVRLAAPAVELKPGAIELHLEPFQQLDQLKLLDGALKLEIEGLKPFIEKLKPEAIKELKLNIEKLNSDLIKEKLIKPAMEKPGEFDLLYKWVAPDTWKWVAPDRADGQKQAPKPAERAK